MAESAWALNDSGVLGFAVEFQAPATAQGWRDLCGVAPITDSLPFWPPDCTTAYDDPFTLADSIPFGTMLFVMKNEPLYMAQRVAKIEDQIARTVGQSREF